MTQTIDYTTLADEALIDLLLTQEDRLPRAAADEFVRRGVPIAPRLVGILDDEALWSDDGLRRWAVVHAFFLLAHMQPPGALEVLLRAHGRAESRGIDWITLDASAMLAAFGPSAIPRLKEAVLNSRLNTWTRTSALQAISEIGHQQAESRDVALSLLREVGRDAAEDSDLRTSAGYNLLSFALPEDRTLVESLAGDFVYNEYDVDEVYSGRPAYPEPESVHWMRFYDPAEIEERQARWSDEAKRREGREEKQAQEPAHPWANVPDDPFIPPPPRDEPPPPFRAGPKVGRNDPCPCASGKKFKKCCGR
jgi:hypothetical protein